MAALDDVVAALRAEGGLLAAAALDPPAGADEELGDLAAAGPRARGGREAELAFVVEAVREGHLAHHGAGRVVDGTDPDLALLVGDRLYALGLERLAAAGDLDAVRALADVIALGAQARAQGDEELAGAVWAAGAVEVGFGGADVLGPAKDAARAGDPAAARALRAAARQVVSDLAPQDR